MADKLALRFSGDGTPEMVAYKLMHDILRFENRMVPTGGGPMPVTQLSQAPVDRNFVLDTYHECLQTVLGNRGVAAPSSKAA
jgi:hypothetical protein